MAQTLARRGAFGLPRLDLQREISTTARPEVYHTARQSSHSKLRFFKSKHKKGPLSDSFRSVLAQSKPSDLSAETREASSSESPASSNGRPSTEALIALEAANHFKQFDTLLTVVGGYDRAVNAEIEHSGPPQSFENGTWPVLLGLAEVPSNGARVPTLSPQAAPLDLRPHIASSSATSAHLRGAEGLAAQEDLRQRQMDQGTSAPLKVLGLRALESGRELQERSLQAASAVFEGVRSLRGSALPLVQSASREGRLIAAAVAFAVVASTAVPLARRAHSHHQQVQTAAAQRAAEEHLQGTVVDLHADNFVPVLTTRPTIVKFYTDWCPYCKQLVPIWDDLAKRVAEKGLNVQVAKLNADVYSEPVMDLNLKGFPSLVLFHGTKPILNYTGPRDLDALLGVVEASYNQMS